MVSIIKFEHYSGLLTFTLRNTYGSSWVLITEWGDGLAKIKTLPYIEALTTYCNLNRDSDFAMDMVKWDYRHQWLEDDACDLWNWKYDVFKKKGFS